MPIQLALYFTIRDANTQTARANINESLKITAEVFFNALSQRRESLLAKVRALSSDYAFKPAANTNEHKTVLSTLRSYQNRVSADVMLLLSLEGSIIADTKHPTLTNKAFYLPGLLKQASNNEYGEASIIDFIDKQPYLLVAVPLFSPEPSHWVIMGFLLTDHFALALQQITKSQVSLFFINKKSESQLGQWRQFASTLTNLQKEKVELALMQQNWQYNNNFDLGLNGKNFVTVALSIRESPQGIFMVLLQRSLAHALLPYQKLHFIIASVFLTSLMVFVLGGHFIANKITKPITTLAQGARKIEQGQYKLHINVDQSDELGQLATRFNSMAKGLSERAKIRSLLGKVVSPAIAQQLINNGVELGGEERNSTILFSDIKNFTQLCENHDAKEIIALLNKLLTQLSLIIDQHHGVIDKYIGDALMALFGVPLQDNNQAENAVLAALSMQQELVKINLRLISDNLPTIGLGIGINSALVIAGNMGSQTRLNYTVIGDGVNLSSRLEGLTRYYDVPILVSDATKQLCKNIAFCQIDTVKVKGKKQSLTIYQPLGERSKVSQIKLRQVEEFQLALYYYHQQEWQSSLKRLDVLIKASPNSQLYQIYLQRVNAMKDSPIRKNWDGVFIHKDK